MDDHHSISSTFLTFSKTTHGLCSSNHKLSSDFPRIHCTALLNIPQIKNGHQTSRSSGQNNSTFIVMWSKKRCFSFKWIPCVCQYKEKQNLRYISTKKFEKMCKHTWLKWKTCCQASGFLWNFCFTWWVCLRGQAETQDVRMITWFWSEISVWLKWAVTCCDGNEHLRLAHDPQTWLTDRWISTSCQDAPPTTLDLIDRVVMDCSEDSREISVTISANISVIGSQI